LSLPVGVLIDEGDFAKTNKKIKYLLSNIRFALIFGYFFIKKKVQKKFSYLRAKESKYQMVAFQNFVHSAEILMRRSMEQNNILSGMKVELS
jgi:hypothetical protein